MKNNGAISCLVISASRKADNRLIHELFLPAIVEAGLTVKNVSSDGQVTPIVDSLSAITTTDVCFLDLSGADRRTLATLGAATALKIPVCLVADDTTLDESVKVYADQVIRFPGHAFPSDYELLKKEIGMKLRAIVGSMPAVERSAEDILKTKAEPLQNRSKPFSPGKVDDPVKFHEHLALKLIFQHGLELGVTLKQLAQEMNKFGIVQATSIAVSGLKRRKLIERHASPAESKDDSVTDVFVLTETGKKWLASHSESMPIPELPIARDGIALGLIEHLLAV